MEIHRLSSIYFALSKHTFKKNYNAILMISEALVKLTDKSRTFLSNVAKLNTSRLEEKVYLIRVAKQLITKPVTCIIFDLIG